MTLKDWLHLKWPVVSYWKMFCSKYKHHAPSVHGLVQGCESRPIVTVFVWVRFCVKIGTRVGMYEDPWYFWIIWGDRVRYFSLHLFILFLCEPPIILGTLVTSETGLKRPCWSLYRVARQHLELVRYLAVYLVKFLLVKDWSHPILRNTFVQCFDRLYFSRSLLAFDARFTCSQA